MSDEQTTTDKSTGDEPPPQQPSQQPEIKQPDAHEANKATQKIEAAQHFGDNYLNRDGHLYAHSTVYQQHYYASVSRQSIETDPGWQIEVNFHQLSQIFVRPQCYSTSIKLIQQQGALIISGTPHNGRRSLAYSLLKELEDANKPSEAQSSPQSGGLQIRQLTSAQLLLDPDDAAFKQIEMRRAYLLCLDSWAETSSITREQLSRLINRVKAKNSYLIIIWHGMLSHVVKQESPHIHLDMQTLPKPLEVFHRHLQHLVLRSDSTVAPEQLDALVAHTDIQELITEATTLRRVVYWAALIADSLRAGRTVDDLIKSCAQLRMQGLQEEAEHILESATSMAHRCLIVAAAALSDITVSQFQRLVQKLQQKLDPLFNDDERAQWKLFWNEPRSRWMELAHAQVSLQEERYQERMAKVDVIKTRPELLSLPLLDLFWREYPGFHAALQSWLLDCGQDLEFRVRLAAANIVGFLSSLYPDLEASIIKEWAVTGDIAVQESAAISLAVARRYTGPAVVDRWLDDWAASDRPRLIFASAIAYAWLGMDQPGLFINGIDKLTRSSNAWVIIGVTGDSQVVVQHHNDLQWRVSAVRFAFSRHLQVAKFGAADYAALLGRIYTWSVSSEKYLRRIGRDIFVDILHTDESDPQPISDAAAKGWPLLLRIIQRSEAAAIPAAGLFAEVLGSEASLEGRKSLKNLVRFVGEVPDARPMLQALLLTIYTSNRPVQQDAAHLITERLLEWARTVDIAQYPAPYSRSLLGWLHKQSLVKRSLV